MRAVVSFSHGLVRIHPQPSPDTLSYRCRNLPRGIRDLETPAGRSEECERGDDPEGEAKRIAVYTYASRCIHSEAKLQYYSDFEVIVIRVQIALCRLFFVLIRRD